LIAPHVVRNIDLPRGAVELCQVLRFALPTTDGTWRIGVSGDAARRWPALVPILIGSMLLAGSLAVFLLVRRMMGA